MKKKLFFCFFPVLLCLLAGCQCKHQWTKADCMQPQTCSLCGVTEGEALGHSFREATCLAPETCTLCGEIQGEALSHTFREATCLAPETCTLCGMTQGETLIHEYSQWTIAEPDTVRSCSLCGGEETIPIDRESYLKQQLTRFWSVASVQIGGGWINVTSRMSLTDSAVMGYWTTIEGGELCYLHLKEDHTLSGYIGYKDGDVSGNWYAWPAAKKANGDYIQVFQLRIESGKSEYIKPVYFTISAEDYPELSPLVPITAKRNFYFYDLVWETLSQEHACRYDVLTPEEFAQMRQYMAEAEGWLCRDWTSIQIEKNI